MNSSLDYSVNPCENFYQFSCGNWQANENVVASNKFDILDSSVKYKLKNILEEALHENLADEPEVVQNTVLLYDRCLYQEKHLENDLFRLHLLLDSIGGWPLIRKKWNPQTFNFESIYANVRSNYGLNWIVGTFLHPKTIENRDYMLIHLDTPTFSLDEVSRLHLDLNTKKITAYKSYIQILASLLLNSTQDRSERNDQFSDYDTEPKNDMGQTFGSNLSFEEDEQRKNITLHSFVNLKKRINSNDWKTQIDDIFRFEAKLNGLIEKTEKFYQSKKHRINRQFRLYRLGELQQKFPYMDWRVMFKKMLANSNQTVTDEMPLFVKEVYYERLGNLLINTPARTIANYFAWSLVEHYSRYSNEDIFVELRQYFENMQNSQRSMKQQKRWLFCYQTLSSRLPYVFDWLYIRKQFDKSARDQVNGMTEKIRNQLALLFASANWMDKSTNSAAQEKLRNMILVIGWQDRMLKRNKFEDMHSEVRVQKAASFFDQLLDLDRSLALMQFQTLNEPIERQSIQAMPMTVVNAYYYIAKNLAVFSAALIQSPVFQTEVPCALNYGGLGTSIAHELMHGFEGPGRSYDAFGRKNLWLSHGSSNRLDKMIACLMNNYKNVMVETTENMFESDLMQQYIRQRLRDTQSENAVDSFGLQLAYKTYKQVSASDSSCVKRLPNSMSSFSSDQLFFLSYAQFWCSAPSNTFALGNAHSLPEHRVLGALRNSVAFRQAFQCPKPAETSDCDLF